MKENWILKKRKAGDLAQQLKISPVIARILRGRIPETEAAAFLDREGPLHDPFRMKDLPEAVSLLLHHREKGTAVRIVGDYDADGVTSSSILYIGLTGLGMQTSIRIPDRVEDGYGIRPYMVDEAVEDGCGLILTCDNGIREFESLAHARQIGVDLILTDHHEITKDAQGNDVLPEASCILNPHRADCPYPFKDLCGAGVAYKLMEGLYQRLNRPLPRTLLGLAALGTVCDLMPLLGENRRIVYQGLQEWNKRPPAGIRAMMDVSGIHELTVYHCGFVIGPMINAGGRLETQDRYIRILLTEDEREAMQLAEQLQMLNAERQKMTAEGVAAGLEQADTLYPADPVKVLHLPDVHESIAGLIAGKIKEHYYRPAIVLTGTQEVLKGSGRSIEGYSMFEKLTEQDALLSRYGGHPMAAGLSIRQECVEAFRKALNASCGLTEADLIRKVTVDSMLAVPQVTLELAQELEALEPYGNGNERPVFASTDIRLTGLRIMGKNRNAARLFFLDHGIPEEAITFRMELLEEKITEKYGADMWRRLSEGQTLRTGLSFDILYNIGLNTFRGATNVQCTICNMR